MGEGKRVRSAGTAIRIARETATCADAASTNHKPTCEDLFILVNSVSRDLIPLRAWYMDRLRVTQGGGVAVKKPIKWQCRIPRRRPDRCFICVPHSPLTPKGGQRIDCPNCVPPTTLDILTGQPPYFVRSCLRLLGIDGAVRGPCRVHVRTGVKTQPADRREERYFSKRGPP
jgi:hypothetical protein